MDTSLLQTTKSILKSLVISCPHGITINELKRDYRNMIGQDIPFAKLGFTKLENFLRTLNDTLVVTGSGQDAMVRVILSDNTVHMSKMIARQKNSSSSQNTLAPIKRQPLLPTPVSNNSTVNHNRIHPVLNQRPLNMGTYNCNSLLNNPYYYNFNSYMPGPYVNYNVFPNQNASHYVYRHQSYGNFINPNYKHNTYQSFRKEPLYKNDIKKDLTTNNNDTPYEGKGNVDINAKNPHDICSNNVSNNKIVSVKEQIRTDENNENIPTVESQLQNMSVANSDDQKNISRFETKEKNMSNENIYNTKCNNIRNKKTIEDSEALPDISQNDLVFRLDFPQEAVKYGQKIPQATIPEGITAGKFFRLFVTEIHNPYKFWFHVYKENNELDILMEDIENYYTSLSSAEEMCLHYSNVKPGQVCAALFLNIWHRAEILELLTNNKAKVFFVDYGTVADVNLRDMKYLLQEFSILNSQALRGSLAYIQPKTHRWSRDATFAFLDMVVELLLYAKVIEVTQENRVVNMILTDTNQDIDFQINDALIKKGYAKFCKREPCEELNNSRIKHFQEKYPTFDMLEKGLYPSFADIGILLAKGIDFELIQDENIIPDIDGDCTIEEFSKRLTFHPTTTEYSQSINKEKHNTKEFVNSYEPIKSSNPFFDLDESNLNIFNENKYNSDPIIRKEVVENVKLCDSDPSNINDKINLMCTTNPFISETYSESNTRVGVLRNVNSHQLRTLHPPPGYENFIPTRKSFSLH